MSKLNYEHVFNTLVEETAKYILRNNLKAMVLGISGGIDSTVVAAICHEVSKKTGIPLIGRSLPIKNKNDEFDVSKLVGEAFCDDFGVVNCETMYYEFRRFAEESERILRSTPSDSSDSYYRLEAIQCGNIQARLRMIYLYNLASIRKGLVMSTDNQTEYQLGFWTIHGDVGDFDPIQGLWKTEVYGLAEWLADHYIQNVTELKEDVGGTSHKQAYAITQSIALTPTDGLGISNSDLDQIGAKSYYDVDRVLQTLTCKASPENNKLQDELTVELGPDVVGKITERHFKSRFKRLLSPIIVPREMYD